MEKLLADIEAYKKEIRDFNAVDLAAVEEFRIKYLGTKGIVKSVMGEMKQVAPEKRKEFGQVLNEFKLFAENKYEELRSGVGSRSQKSGVGKAGAWIFRCREIVFQLEAGTRLP